MDRRTTSWETSDGIVTTSEPESRGTSDDTVARRSVPGGRSITSASSAPQAVSARNSRSALASTVPRQVWASAWVGACQTSGAASDGSRKSIDITLTPSTLTAGSTPWGDMASVRPRTPRIFAIEGPLRSASSTPTRQPSRASRHARLPVIDDFPTPPFPETTATTWAISPRRRSTRDCWART
jgi:hypothetical protein